MSEEARSPSPEHMPELPEGLSAVVLPDLGERNREGDIELVSKLIPI